MKQIGDTLYAEKQDIGCHTDTHLDENNSEETSI